MKNESLESIVKELRKGKKMAIAIIQELEKSDTSRKLDILDKLDSLPELPTDNATWDLKEFNETKEAYKRLYTMAARSIMQIINTDFMHGRHDPEKSFNYADPVEPLKAAEKIGFLPKAYMGGPIKAAITSPYHAVNRVAVSYYDVLPQDMKYSESFPEPLRKRIRTIKQQGTC